MSDATLRRAAKREAALRAEVERLKVAGRAVLADHDERMEMYSEANSQPNRIHVMGLLRKALHPAAPGAGEGEEAK